MPDYPQVDPNPTNYDFWGNPTWMVLAPNVTNDPLWWGVSSATTGESKAPLLRAQFEGYAQVARDGINQPGQVCKVDVSPIPKELAMDMYAFLDAQATYGKPFLWTPPAPFRQVQVLWTCEQYAWKRAGGTICGITAEFQYLARP